MWYRYIWGWAITVLLMKSLTTAMATPLHTNNDSDNINDDVVLWGLVEEQLFRSVEGQAASDEEEDKWTGDQQRQVDEVKRILTRLSCCGERYYTYTVHPHYILKFQWNGWQGAIRGRGFVTHTDCRLASITEYALLPVPCCLQCRLVLTNGT